MIHTQDADFILYCGDVREVLAGLEPESVHCVVTSPPYWGLRDYGTGTWEGGDAECDHLRNGNPRQPHERRTSTLDGGTDTIRVQEEANVYRDTCGKCGATRTDNQLGLEPTPDLYLANMVEVFREVRRVLRGDGTCWVNMGDSYAGHNLPGWREGNEVKNGGVSNKNGVGYVPGLKPKDLCMIPARLALALQQDGWYLRSQIVWSKPNPMPESVTDRPTTSHEFVYLLAKSARYFFDQEAVREPHNHDGRTVTQVVGQNGSLQHRDGERWPNSGRNLRSVWEIPTQPYPEAHFATYPEELVRRCILAGTSERGCCPECGAPWVRIIETNNPSLHAADDDKRGWSNTHSKTSNAQSSKSLHRNPGGVYSSAVVKGWKQTCDHNAEPIPCTVLDPFGGSGTTALVARKHGRRSVLVELNPSYCELAARLLSQLSLLSEMA